MRLEQFQYVVEVARCRSMAKAAKRLFLSQPALSTSISSLESELGFQVFERSFQGVALTEKGEQFLEISRRIVEQVESISSISQNEELQTINIAAVPAACNSLIIDLIHQLRKKEPHTIINVQELRPNKILTALEDRSATISIGIHTPNTKGEILKQAARCNLQIEDVFHDTLCVYLPKNHPLSQKKVVSRQDLAQETPVFFSDFVHMEHSDADPAAIESNRNYFSFTDQTSIKQAVSQNLGYAIFPWQMAVDDIYISSGKITARPLDGEDVKLTTFLAYRRNVLLCQAEEHALSLLRKLYKDLQIKQQKTARSFAESFDIAK